MQEQKKQEPTKEELLSFFKEQVELKKAQLELHELNANIAKARAEEIRALAFIAQMTTASSSSPEDDIDHQLTQEDLDDNPSLKEQGLKVGDSIKIPKEAGTPSKKLKK